MKGKKLERPFRLEMDFGEALARFVRTDLEEVKRSQKEAAEGKGGDGPSADPAQTQQRPAPKIP